jgi:hypothetical protein
LIGGITPTGAENRLHHAAAMVSELPLRWSHEDSGASQEQVITRGWFRGPDECARILAAAADLEVSIGGGFGGQWPLVRESGRVVAPALPVVVEKRNTRGPDGAYHLAGSDVWREAVGAEEPYLVAGRAQAPPGAPFDLLWFGEGERFLVRKGLLEIDDLFGTVRVPADPRLLERILIRGARRDPELLSSLPPTKTGAQVVEVRRPTVLSHEERICDATTFLAGRADVQHVRRHGSTVEVRLVGDRTATFALEEEASGWTLMRRDGDDTFTELRLDRSSSALSLSATLDPRVDALAPGMRGRLIFDLRSDLVVLG